MKAKQTQRSVKKTAFVDSMSGPFLEEKRLRAKVSLVFAAKYLDISVAQLNEYESGKTPIPLHQIFAYSNLLNIDPDMIEALLEKSYPTKLKRVR